MGEIVRELRDSSTARVPSVPPGRAIVFTRYDEEKAVVLNPADFRRLAELDDDLDELSQTAGASDLVLEALDLEDRPATPIEDPARIKSLLGL